MNVSLDEIEAVSIEAMVAHGADRAVAASVAHAIRVAEAVDNKICGLEYLESYCLQLTTGRVNGSADPVVTEHAGAVKVDGGLGFAQPAFAAGFRSAVRAAKASGICGFSVAHTHTCTSLGYFTDQFAEENLLAIGVTNASPRVAPPGGTVPVLGTNPIAMSVPDGDGGKAFGFDFSTSMVALGRVASANKQGQEIPEGWALDPSGRPTTDPAQGLAGSLLPAGGYKGYGIALMVEVLASAMTGSRPSVDVPPLKTAEGDPHDLGQFYLVVDPASYTGPAFYDALAGLAESVDAQDGARLPGSATRSADPVEVRPELWAQVKGLANRTTEEAS